MGREQKVKKLKRYKAEMNFQSNKHLYDECSSQTDVETDVETGTPEDASQEDQTDKPPTADKEKEDVISTD